MSHNSQQTEAVPPFAPPPGSTLWVTSVVMTRMQSGVLSIANTLSWRACASKDEAVGVALDYARSVRPDFSIEQWTTQDVFEKAENNRYPSPVKDSAPVAPETYKPEAGT